MCHPIWLLSRKYGTVWYHPASSKLWYLTALSFVNFQEKLTGTSCYSLRVWSQLCSACCVFGSGCTFCVNTFDRGARDVTGHLMRWSGGVGETSQEPRARRRPARGALALGEAEIRSRGVRSSSETEACPHDVRPSDEAEIRSRAAGAVAWWAMEAVGP
jgi:hypothetical protein